MRKLFTVLTLLSAVILISVEAHANTISTFSLTQTTYDGYLSGFVDIDTTLGIPEYGEFNFTYTIDPLYVPPQRITFGGDFTYEKCVYCLTPNDVIFQLTGPNNSFLTLETDTPLIDFIGGGLCNAVPGEFCNGGGEGPDINLGAAWIGNPAIGFSQIRWTESINKGELVLQHTVETPEPSSFIFLGTGTIGLLGVFRRRYSLKA